MADRANDQMGMQEDVDALRNDLRQIKDDVATLAQDFVRAAKGGAGEARARMSDMAGHQWSHFRDYTGDATDWGRDALEAVKQKVEERPVIAAVAALGIGMLLGKLLLPGGGHHHRR